MFQIYSSCSKSSTHVSHVSFTELLTKIRNNPESSIVEEIRRRKQQGLPYDFIKKKQLTCFSPNSFSRNDFRSNNKAESTGYIYFDFDHFSNEEELQDFKTYLMTIPYVAAVWRSVSGKGLGLLFRINKEPLTKFNFHAIWSRLDNAFFQGKADTKTNDFFRLNIISHDHEVFVNEEVQEYDDIHEKSNGIILKTELPFEMINHQANYTVVLDGFNYIEINTYELFKFKIPHGKRNSTLGALCMQLIYLNPKASTDQIIHELNHLNNKACTSPLTSTEVKNIVLANMKRKTQILSNENGVMSKYFTLKHVFFNRNARLSRTERSTITKRLEYQIQLINMISDYLDQTDENKIIDLLNDPKIKKGTIAINDQTYNLPFKSFISFVKSNYPSSSKNIYKIFSDVYIIGIRLNIIHQRKFTLLEKEQTQIDSINYTSENSSINYTSENSSINYISENSSINYISENLTKDSHKKEITDITTIDSVLATLESANAAKIEELGKYIPRNKKQLFQELTSKMQNDTCSQVDKNKSILQIYLLIFSTEGLNTINVSDKILDSFGSCLNSLDIYAFHFQVMSTNFYNKK